MTDKPKTERPLSRNNWANLWCAVYAAEFVRLQSTMATSNAPLNAQEASALADVAVASLRRFRDLTPSKGSIK